MITNWLYREFLRVNEQPILKVLQQKDLFVDPHELTNLYVLVEVNLR